MKKIIVSSIAAVSLIGGAVFADSAPAKTGLIFSGEGSYSNIVVDSSETISYQGHSLTESFKSGNGLGFGGYIAFDYALSDHVTGGIKSGFNYTSQLAVFATTGSHDVDFNSASIPILLTGKYFFNSGFFVGAEGGVEWQKLKVDNGRDHVDSDWNITPIVGALGGYQWENGFSVSGSMDYIFGKSVDVTNTESDPNLKDNALSNFKIGLQVSYLLPM